MPKTLCTIGYEKARLAGVIPGPKGGGGGTLVAVRARPISRRPGFSKRQLAAALEEAGIGYVGLRALGTPPEGREAGRAGEWDRFWAIVEDRLASGGRGGGACLRGARRNREGRSELPVVLRGRLAALPPPPHRRDPQRPPRLRG